MNSLVPAGRGLTTVWTWNDEGRRALLAHILDGHSIEESALRMSKAGAYVPASEAMKEVMRHGGVWPFIRTYRPDITREEVVRMQDLYHAHRGDSKTHSGKHLKLQQKIVHLAHRPVHDDTVEARFVTLIAAIADRLNVNTVPFVFIIRAASCSERDAILLETGDVIPTISVRFELPRHLPRARLARERGLYLLLLARMTREIAFCDRGEGTLRDALRSAKVRRLKLFVTNYRRGKGWEHMLIGENDVLPEVLFIT